MSGPPVLEVAVTLPLGARTLRVEFTTHRQVTGIFGVSGAGKSSLLEAVAGLRPAARGRIALGGEPWLDSPAGVEVPPQARGVGYVPQDSLLFPHLDVQGNLRSGRRARAQGDDSPTWRGVVRVLELEPLLHRPVATLSGGERQRVALGRALCSAPRLLLLDEPFAGLDAALRQRVLPFLRRVLAEFQLPVLLVSHDPVEVQALCDELVVLGGDRVLAQGPPREVLIRPEVFPLAQHEGFRNLLPAVVMEPGPRTSRVRLGGADGAVLTAPATALPAGAEVLVGIRADDIILALHPPEGISARNAVAATVSAVADAGGHALVSARVAPGAPPLVAEVTAEAVRELGIAAGTPLYLLLKTSAMVVYGDEGGAGAA